MNTLCQRIDKIEVEHCDWDRTEDRQPNQHREDRINRNHDRYVDDECYLKNIKLDVSNFDCRLDPQFYLDWVMSLERCFKWYEMSQDWRVCFAAMKLVG